ncbi:hypothetical protein [Microbacterium sp. cf332]|uniref:hypothetical protein n=1 Tax=Microbacterium sp. cf332 TaxID=1761804 RepID=UPI000B8161F3|nr:hypothetical protein [Microbacterium sp. cf332]
MSLHDKVSRRVRRWDADIVVNPRITPAQWRAVRRPCRIRIAAGLVLSVVVAALVAVQLVGGWHLRPLRVLAFAGIVVVILLLASVAVTVANARASLPQQHPHLFWSRRRVLADPIGTPGRMRQADDSTDMRTYRGDDDGPVTPGLRREEESWPMPRPRTTELP